MHISDYSFILSVGENPRQKEGVIAAFALYGGQHCAVHGAETGCVAGDGKGGGGACSELH